jgi:hypothetical protein
MPVGHDKGPVGADGAAALGIVLDIAVTQDIRAWVRVVPAAHVQH